MTGFPPEPPRRSDVDDVRRLGQDEQRSIGEIVSDLSRNFTQLLRQEVALAKAELQQSASRAGKGAGMLTGAGVAANMALLFLSLGAWWAIAVALGTVDRPSLGWSGLIVAAIWGVIAAILAASGKSQLKNVEGLPQTTETVSKIPHALKGEEENR